MICIKLQKNKNLKTKIWTFVAFYVFKKNEANFKP